MTVFKNLEISEHSEIYQFKVLKNSVLSYFGSN